MEDNRHMWVEADYFSEFHCTGGSCTQSCCACNWRVWLTSPEYSRLRTIREPEFAAKIKKAFRRNRRTIETARYARMDLSEEHGCVFLDKEGLCSLQKEYGAAILPDTCKIYPRVRNLIGGNLEYSCLLSCEEVIRLLWLRTKGLDFVCSPIEGKFVSAEAQTQGEIPRYFDIQTLCIDILQNRAYSLDTRVVLLGLAMQALPTAVKEGAAAIGQWLSRYALFVEGDGMKEVAEQLHGDSLRFLLNNTAVCGLCEQTLTSGKHKELFQLVLDRLHASIDEQGEIRVDPEAYQKANQQLAAFLRGKEYFLENVLVNLWFGEAYPSQILGIWESYVLFCQLYSLLKFLLAGVATETLSQQEVTQVIVLWARIFGQNIPLAKQLTAELSKNQNDSLPSLALLIYG